MTITAPSHAQETGMLIAMLNRLSRLDSGHDEHLISRETASEMLRVLTGSIGYVDRHLAEIVEGAGRLIAMPRPTTDEMIGCPPGGWRDVSGFWEGQRDFSLIHNPPPFDPKTYRYTNEQLNLRLALRDMDLGERTAYLMGVLAAAEDHFHPAPF